MKAAIELIRIITFTVARSYAPFLSTGREINGINDQYRTLRYFFFASQVDYSSRRASNTYMSLLRKPSAEVCTKNTEIRDGGYITLVEKLNKQGN